MERIATWLLARDNEFVARARDPFAVRSRLYKVPGAIACDALKIAYVEHQHHPRYRDVFSLFSTWGKPMSLLFRLGYALRFPGVRRCLDRLGEY